YRDMLLVSPEMKALHSLRCLNRIHSLAALAAILLLLDNTLGAQPGSLDSSFNPGTGVDQSVFAVAIQTDGKLVIGGDFTLANGVSRAGVARLNTDGSVDAGFDPGSGADDLVSAVALQGSKVIIAGYFTTVDGAARGSIARLNGDGS